jgi:hypothetical protein
MSFGKKILLDRLWFKYREACRAYDQEVKSSGGHVSLHMKNLKRDSDKLLAEYRKAKGGGDVDTMDPNSRAIYDKRKVVGDLLKKTGPDSHPRLED